MLRLEHALILFYLDRTQIKVVLLMVIGLLGQLGHRAPLVAEEEHKLELGHVPTLLPIYQMED